MAQSVTIELKPNGPLLVKGLETLRNSNGEIIPTEEVFALCRCGQSGKKPFCDGTHKKVGFSGDRTADGSGDKRDSYRGKKITIHDNRFICAHAGECTSGLAAVFKYGKSPWIDPDGAEVEAVIETIGKCPSGALSYSINDVGQPPPDCEPAITVTKDGPYAVEGEVECLAVSFGEGACKTRYTLCRCGQSKNKPFCDGSHYDAGFKHG